MIFSIIYRLSDSVLARILTAHALSDIRGDHQQRSVRWRNKRDVFCVARGQSECWRHILIWRFVPLRSFFARPADSAGPFFVDCFTIYRGCLLWVFVGARSRDAFCRRRRRRRRRLLHSLCARDADVYVQSTWTTFGSLWAPRDVMVKEIRLFSTRTGPINCSLALPPAEMSQFLKTPIHAPTTANWLLFPYSLMISPTVRVTDFYQWRSPDTKVFLTRSLPYRWLTGLTFIAGENHSSS